VGRYQAAVFDMDGTLFDSEPVYLAAWQATARSLGFELTLELYLSTVGHTLEASYAALAEHFGPAFPVAAFREAWPARWQQHVLTRGILFKPGVLELLNLLKRRGLPLAVATSSHRREAHFLLAHSGLWPRFRAVATGDEVAAGKPHPDIYLLAAERLGVAPAACLAFEDSDAGATAALAAGMTTLVVPDLLDPGPDVRGRAQVLPSLERALAPVERLLGA
jgi:HAD superfamily hydrolase (TIGR01509 family)